MQWRGSYYEGIASLSAILKSKGHHVQLAHIYNLSKSENIIEQVSAGFDLIAFSTTTPMFPFVQYCSKMLKKHFKDIPILCGGAHATSATTETLKNSDIDYLCVGEGEYFILDFLEYLQGSRSKNDVKNLAYKNGANEVIVNELRQPIDPLDDLPFPDREIFDLQHRNATVGHILAGRGCPYQCAYCSNSHLNKIYKNKFFRIRKPDTVISEIRLLLKRYPSIQQLVFLDDVFTLDKNWLKAFCKLYGNLFKLPFIALAHPATISEEKIKTLKEAGCDEVRFGIQSGNEYIRNDIMLRHVSNDNIKESIRILKKYGMKFVADVIFGVPLETKAQMLDTIKFCAEDDIRVKSHIFYPLPATRLEQIAVENGLLDRNVYGEDYHCKTILNYTRLHKAEILFFHLYCNYLILIYRIFAYSLTNLFSKKIRLYILDNVLCSDIFISVIIMMRQGVINLRSSLRKMYGKKEYRLEYLKEVLEVQ